ncbi:MAG: hypothetical protein ACPKPY_09020 [Nitrososphaeraceae archaeon]
MNILNLSVVTTLVILVIGLGAFSLSNSENIYAQMSSEKSSNDTSDSRTNIIVAPQESGEMSKFPGSNIITAPQGPLAVCTKWCTDCQTCDTYCCEGTSPDDIGTVYVPDDE